MLRKSTLQAVQGRDDVRGVVVSAKLGGKENCVGDEERPADGCMSNEKLRSGDPADGSVIGLAAATELECPIQELPQAAYGMI